VSNRLARAGRVGINGFLVLLKTKTEFMGLHHARKRKGHLAGNATVVQSQRSRWYRIAQHRF
jgi:hypothetical protein